MRRKTVDMDAIAKELGCSKTTVHYALRNTGRVSDGMRQRVLEAAEGLGYRPNLIARSLRAQRSATLGVVVIGLASSYYAHVLEGIDTVAQQHEHSMLLVCSYGDPVKEREHIRLLLDKGVDGLIVMPADPEANSEFYSRLTDEGTQFVFVDRHVPGMNADSVATDNLMGGYLAGRHLVQSGRERVLVVTTTSRERRSTSVQARLNGCNQALQEAGLDTALVLGPNVPDRFPDEQFAYQAVREHLLAGGGGGFDGVFAVHDGLAYGTIEALTEANLRVPEDVSVVGFDDQDPSAYFHPPLTTIRQPTREIGGEAVRLLFRRLEEGDAPLPRQRLSLEPALVVRKSS